MNRRRNGIAIEPIVSKTKAKKTVATKASTDTGKFAFEVVPVKLHEFVKREKDGTFVTTFTPFDADIKQLEQEGHRFVATHETKQPVYSEFTE